MKKTVFKVLCMVLIIALLAPNAFAATPTPEVPLVDAATVARVKQEVADGEITDMEDLFLVAYQHLGADLEEEGMTAYINEDGTLGITQILSSEKKKTRSGGEVEEYTFATTTMMLVDNEGRQLTDYDSYYNSPDTAYGGAASLAMSATHTAYYNGRCDLSGFYPLYEIQLAYMVTSFSCPDVAHPVTRIRQNYTHYITYVSGYGGTVGEESSKTTSISSQVAGSCTFTPATRSWLTDGDNGTGRLETSATIYLTGVAQPVTITTANLLTVLGD